MINYVFDVDGTLTPPRQKIDPIFHEWFRDWMDCKNVFLISGSDAEKTIEQVGDIWWWVKASYQCAGNEIYVEGKRLYSLNWPGPGIRGHLISILETKWRESHYPHKLGKDGNHIEIRKGMVNFSTVGRNCSLEERQRYFEWDQKHKEREELALFLSIKSQLGVEVSIGGQISIDICPPGKNKGQIADYLEGPIYFFGDKTRKGGNDYPLAQRLQEEPHKVFQVSGPEEVKSILEGL